MKLIVDYLDSGKPLISLRTTTHAFNYAKHKDSPYARYSYNSKDPKGGFGREVVGETWVNHYGVHKKESTRGLIAPGMEDHPIVKGVEDIWGPSDVYGTQRADRRQQADHHGPGPHGDGADRQAEPEQGPGPGGLDPDLHRPLGQDRADLRDHDGPRRRPQERGVPQAPGQRLLLVPGRWRTGSRPGRTSTSWASTTPSRSAPACTARA